MSKMLDAMDNKSARKNVQGLEIHSEIAKTYFHAPQKKAAKKKSKVISLLPWVVTSLVIIISVGIVLSRSSIDIKVRLLGEIPTFNVSKPGESVERGEFLLVGGRPQEMLVKNAYFSGDGKAFSSARDDQIVLCNARGAGWADYTIALKEPVDLNNLDVRYTAKGARGDEYLVLVITDSNNRIYRMEKDLSSALTNEWKTYTINFKPVNKMLDLSSIKTIRFEFGSLTAGNYIGAIINLKDICLIKTRRLKWL